jgi:hypothetical protein
MKETQFYDVCCRKKVNVPPSSISLKTMKNGKLALHAIHDVCGCKLFKFVKLDDKTKLMKKYGSAKKSRSRSVRKSRSRSRRKSRSRSRRKSRSRSRRKSRSRSRRSRK